MRSDRLTNPTEMFLVRFTPGMQGLPGQVINVPQDFVAKPACDGDDDNGDNGDNGDNDNNGDNDDNDNNGDNGDNDDNDNNGDKGDNRQLSEHSPPDYIDLTNVPDVEAQADGASLLQDSVMTNLAQHCYTPAPEIDNVARFFAVTREQVLNGIQLPGTTRTLRHYQLEAIYNFIQRTCYQHSSSRKAQSSPHGSLLCDETGLGKSLCALGIQAITRLIYIALIDIANNPASHNSDNIVDLEAPDQQCPSGKAFGVECPCIMGSLSKAYARTLTGGATFMIVPSHLVNEWCAKATQFFAPAISAEVAQPLCQTVVYGKAGMLLRCEPCLQLSGYNEREAVDVNAIHAILPVRTSFTTAPASRRRDCESWTKMVAACGPQTARAPPVPQVLDGNCARSFIVVSRTAFTLRPFGILFESPTLAGGVEIKLLRSCWASLILVDESHLVMERDSQFWTAMRCLQDINRRKGTPIRTKFCFMTATPYLKSPKSIIGPVSVLASEQETALDTLDKDFRQAVRSNDTSAPLLINRMVEFSLFIMIARRNGSVVFGMPVEAGIKDIAIQDVWIAMPPHLDATLSPIVDQLRAISSDYRSKAVYFYYAATMMPSIAAAAADMTDPSKYDILAQEVQDAWTRETPSPAMRRFLTHCRADDWFCKFNDILDQAKRCQQHVLVACATPGLAAHVAMCLKYEPSMKKGCTVHPIFSNASGGSLKRSQYIETIEADARASTTSHIVVGNAELFATGMDNLVFCNNLVIIGDIEGRSSMAQVIGRINRGHQTLPIFVYHLQSTHETHRRVREKRKITAAILFEVRKA